VSYGTVQDRCSIQSQSDSFLLDSTIKWQSLIETTIPFFTVPYNRGDDLSRFPFYFIEPVTDSICTFITLRAINQDKEVPVWFRDSITTGAWTVKNDLSVRFHFTNSLPNLLK
jgi:hypothetical protein